MVDVMIQSVNICILQFDRFTGQMMKVRIICSVCNNCQLHNLIVRDWCTRRDQ